MSLTDRIKEKGRQLGFDLVGITTPDAPPHSEFYLDWIAAGFHGEMAYLARPDAVERRRDPRQNMPECKSIVVVAVNYFRPEPAPAGKPQGQGRVARYAWGADYHEVIPRRLHELVNYIEAEAGRPVAHKLYTDTGPLLERDLAQRAGLGWIGKNTNLIHPRRGSWLLLGEALLDLALEPDPPFAPDLCGTCTRCIEACPTEAILEGRLLDARRCISYHTIELKGEIPGEFHSAIGDWVFGCDICQEVCPWNIRFAEGGAAASPQAGARADLSPRPQASTIAPAELLEMSDEDFKARFAGTPLARPKRGGLARNAKIVAGNSRSKE